MDVSAKSLRLDPSSAQSASAQLIASVVSGVRQGGLAPGARLPTVRALAAELGIAPNTVAKAYRELEGLGLLETRGRGGTFLAAAGDARQQELQRAASAYAELAQLLSIDVDSAARVVLAALGESPTSAGEEVVS